LIKIVGTIYIPEVNVKSFYLILYPR